MIKRLRSTCFKLAAEIPVSLVKRLKIPLNHLANHFIAVPEDHADDIVSVEGSSFQSLERQYGIQARHAVVPPRGFFCQPTHGLGTLNRDEQESVLYADVQLQNV